MHNDEIQKFKNRKITLTGYNKNSINKIEINMNNIVGKIERQIIL